MNFAALVGLIDEADCIEQCIDHHLSIGFDYVVVTDLGSTDGSLEIVKRKTEADERIKLLHGNQSLTKRHWPSEALQFAVNYLKADRIAHIDPDEFWIAQGRSIRTVSRVKECDILSVERYNAIQTLDAVVEGRNICAKRLMDQIVYFERPTIPISAPPLTNLYSARGGPKVMHRAVDAKISDGAHSVQSKELKTMETPADLIILHFPLSSYSRFAAKMKNASAFLNANPHLPDHSAWHWRRFVRAWEAGELDREYRSQFVSEVEIQNLLAVGKATRVRDLF
jgi:hypothetical protein